MASYPAPSESFIGIIYNPIFFNRINLTDYVTYGYVQDNFLSRVGIASSIATLTTFSGSVTVLGVLTISGGLNLTGGLTVDTLQVNSTSDFIGQSTFTVAPILPTSYEFLRTNAQTFSGVKTFASIPVLPTGVSFITTGPQTFTGTKTFLTAPVLPTGFQFITNGPQTITGGKTFLTAPILPTGLQYVNTGPQTYDGTKTFTGIPVLPATVSFITQGPQSITGTKTFNTPIVSSGASITANTILSSSLVNNSITQNQIASPFTLLNSGSAQTILGDKILNGTNTTNDMILNIFSAVSFYTGTIGFIPACTSAYLNPISNNFDSMLYVGQSIGTGPNQPYGFCICDYNTGATGFRMSGTGASGNCNIVMNANTEIIDLLTLQGGLSVNSGNVSFDSAYPTTTLGSNSGLNNNEFATVGYAKSIGGSSILSLNNTWTGTNTFNTSIPTTTLTPSTSTQFATVGYTTSAISSASLIPLNNTWTGTNTFNSSIPTTTLTPSTSTQFATVGYTTSAISSASLLGQNNTWTGTNTFNTSIPTTTLTPSTSTQFATVGYTTSAISSASLLPLNNIWTGTNRYDNDVTFKGQISIPDQTTTVAANCNINILGTTLGNYVNWYQNGLSDSVSAGYDAFDQLNYDIYPFSTTSNINCRIGTTANPFKSLVLNGNVTVTPQGQLSQPIGTIYNTGVTTTFTTLPPYILFDPRAGMGFILPVPGPATAGQIFVIRKVGGGATVSFTVPGNLPVWVPLNAAISAGLTALSISTVWQFTILSTLNAYVTIA